MVSDCGELWTPRLQRTLTWAHASSECSPSTLIPAVAARQARRRRWAGLSGAASPSGESGRVDAGRGGGHDRPLRSRRVHRRALARAMLYDPRWPLHARHFGATVKAPKAVLRSRSHRSLFDLRGMTDVCREDGKTLDTACRRLASQRDHGIHAHGAAHREQAAEQRHRHQDRRRLCERERGVRRETTKSDASTRFTANDVARPSTSPASMGSMPSARTRQPHHDVASSYDTALR